MARARARPISSVRPTAGAYAVEEGAPDPNLPSHIDRHDEPSTVVEHHEPDATEVRMDESGNEAVSSRCHVRSGIYASECKLQY